MIEIKNGFKTIQFAFFFTALDNKDTRVYRFLLPKLLTSHTEKYPTKSLLSRKLEELYGARFFARTERHANLNIISFDFTMVDPVIVRDTELLDQALELLNDVFYQRDYFNEEIFLEEKRLLIEQWESLRDNKKIYANYEFNKLFFAEDAYAEPLTGTLEEIKKVTLEDINRYFKTEFLKQDVKIIINGRLEDEFDLVKSKLKIHEKDEIFTTYFSFRNPRELIHKEEETVMNQAILKLGYMMPIFRFDRLYEAALCFNTILGGHPESRLFREIRENQGLCYSISSGYDFYKGVIMVSSGVSKDKRDYALAEIKKLIENFKNEPITAEELHHAKSYLRHQIKSSLDYQSYLTKSAFIKLLLKDEVTIDERLARIDNVSLTDLNEVLKNLYLDTTYVLYGGDE